MPMFKKSLAVLLILVAAAIGGTMYGYYSEQETLALDAGTNMPPEPPRSVTVYVSGEVKKPGLVILPEGKRVADAVNEVGGVIETADIDAYRKIKNPAVRPPCPRGTIQTGGSTSTQQTRRNCRSFPASVPRCRHVLWSIVKQTGTSRRLKI